MVNSNFASDTSLDAGTKIRAATFLRFTVCPTLTRLPASRSVPSVDEGSVFSVILSKSVIAYALLKSESLKVSFCPTSPAFITLTSLAMSV
jgi:hypothetical protein